MARPPARSKKPANPPQGSRQAALVPTENLRIIGEGLGFDVLSAPPDQVRAVLQRITTSISASPYPSADMLGEYVNAGLSDVKDRVLQTIDQQATHRQSLERLYAEGSEKRQNSGQWGALGVAILGVAGALVGGYLGVPTWLCATVVIVAVGGPSTATVLARFLDRNR